MSVINKSFFHVENAAMLGVWIPKLRLSDEELKSYCEKILKELNK